MANDYSLIINLETIKNALRIDGTQDDALLQGYISAAKDYVANAITDSDEESEQLQSETKYKLAVILLVQFWYSNRTTDMKRTPYQVLSLIQQLRGKLWQ